MRWLIVGAGAMGSILAAHLSQAGEDVTVLARGSRAKLLRHAEMGTYSKQEVGRGLDPNWLRSYLNERAGRWSVVPDVRRLVRFERHNLLDGPPHDSAEFDVILARNVLIYFADGARARVFAGSYSGGVPGNWFPSTLPPPNLPVSE